RPGGFSCAMAKSRWRTATRPGTWLAATPIAEAHSENDKILPNPIQVGSVIGQFPLKHFYFPTIPNPAGITSNVVSNGTGDPSTIRDFQGIVGSPDLPPTGKVIGDPLGGSFWAADCRFMQGRFVDRDHHVHHGTSFSYASTSSR